jgi:hypothetical protein
MSLKQPFLPPEIVAELTDERFTTRQHYSRATYADGCHGPMCRLKEKHRGRKRLEERAQEAGVAGYDPRYRKLDDEQVIEIVKWHLAYTATRRAGLPVPEIVYPKAIPLPPLTAPVAVSA